MSNVISNRLIIGNYLIESVKNDKYRFSFDELNRFDDMLSEYLQKIDYYSSFDDDGILEFLEEYPSFISYDSVSNLYILIDDKKDVILPRLYRYFRSGITKPITTAISEVSSIYWGENAERKKY